MNVHCSIIFQECIHCSTSDNILSIPRVYVVIHVASSIIAIVAIASVVHIHIRPRVPGNNVRLIIMSPPALQKFSLVVWVTAAHVHHVTRSHVDAGL